MAMGTIFEGRGGLRGSKRFLGTAVVTTGTLTDSFPRARGGRFCAPLNNMLIKIGSLLFPINYHICSIRYIYIYIRVISVLNSFNAQAIHLVHHTHIYVFVCVYVFGG